MQQYSIKRQNLIYKKMKPTYNGQHNTIHHISHREQQNLSTAQQFEQFLQFDIQECRSIIKETQQLGFDSQEDKMDIVRFSNQGQIAINQLKHNRYLTKLQMKKLLDNCVQIQDEDLLFVKVQVQKPRHNLKNLYMENVSRYSESKKTFQEETQRLSKHQTKNTFLTQCNSFQKEYQNQFVQLILQNVICKHSLL
uniref:Uncharacterized protein n=1 Tax=Trepomonas sp. PC1 TaxID=1076344 RepID=A0A146JYX8_9EUKA|eukprot:JAP89910.1 Hypothetical protein TPC1_30595 [Trepomonas sp. PC1]